MRRPCRLILCLVLAVSCSACSNLYLHSDKREEQAKQLEEAWKGVQLTDYFAKWRTRRTDYTAAALRAVEERQRAEEVATRATVATVCVAAGDDSLARQLAERERRFLKDVCTTTACRSSTLGQVRALANAEAKAVADRADQHVLRLHLRALGVQAPTCAGLSAARSEASDSHVIDALDALARECQSEEKATNAGSNARVWLTQAAAPAWTTWSRLNNERELQAKDENAAAALMVTYKATLSAYQQAVDNAKALRETGGRLAAPSEKLREVLAAIAGSDQASAEAARLRIARIDAVLAALGGDDGEGKPSDGTVAALLFNRIAVSESERAAAALPAPSLLLRRDLDQQRLAQAERLVALRKAKIALLEQQLGFELDELTGVLNGADRLATIPAAFAHVRLDDLMADTLPREPRKRPDPGPAACQQIIPASVPTEVRASAFAVATNLLRAIGRDRAEAARVGVLVASLDHERWAVEQEANLAQHATVVDALVQETAAFGRGGQRYADYADPVEALLLLFIGKGVN